MRERDDDHQVKSHSEQRDGGQQNVIQHCLKVRTHWLPAGGVEELWKAEFSSLPGLHHRARGEAAEQLSGQSFLSYNRFISILPDHPPFLLNSAVVFLSIEI